MQKLHYNVIFVRFMQKYNGPDASNFEKYMQINFLYYHVKIISEMQKCISVALVIIYIYVLANFTIIFVNYTK